MFMKKSLIASTMVALGLATVSTPAQASLEPFIGQIMPTGFNFCPRGFLNASGQLVSIASNTALFSLLGTTFGGDGRTTFALPNLNGRMPIHVGQGPGLPNYADGQFGGTTTMQLTTSNLPSHTHSARMRAFSGAGNTVQPVRNSLATATVGADIYSDAAPTAAMSNGNINVVATGQGQAFANQTPGTVILYCIATQGVFPPRN